MRSLTILAMISSYRRNSVCIDSSISPRRTRNIKQWDALLRRAASNGKKVAAIGLREATVAFGKIRRNRQRGPVELVRKETEGVPEEERWQHNPMRNRQSSETAAVQSFSRI